MEEISRRKFIPYFAAGIGGLMLTCTNGMSEQNESENQREKERESEKKRTIDKPLNETIPILPNALKKGK